MPFTWKDAGNEENPNWSGKHLMIHYYAEDGETDPELAILLNFESFEVPFTLPEGRDWARVVDTQAWFDSGDGNGEPGWFADNPTEDTSRSANVSFKDPVLLDEPSYTVPARSIVILEQQQ